MARVTYQPCAVCTTKFPVRPQAPHAKFCSTKCRMQHHRQEKKEQQVKTEGNNTMSSASKQAPATLPLQFVFSESEYQARCNNKRDFYLNRFERPSTDVPGAIVEFVPGTLIEALDLYHRLLGEGFEPLEPQPGSLPTATLVSNPMGDYISLYLKKPAGQQEQDLNEIYAQVKDDYEAELSAAFESEIERQIDFTLAQAERARQQRIEAERAELAQRTRDELAASRQKLREELIAGGKLNADGSAA